MRKRGFGCMNLKAFLLLRASARMRNQGVLAFVVGLLAELKLAVVLDKIPSSGIDPNS